MRLTLLTLVLTAAGAFAQPPRPIKAPPVDPTLGPRVGVLEREVAYLKAKVARLEGVGSAAPKAPPVQSLVDDRPLPTSASHWQDPATGVWWPRQFAPVGSGWYPTPGDGSPLRAAPGVA